MPASDKGSLMDKMEGGRSAGGKSFQDMDFQRKLEEARARRMKVLAERGDVAPAPNPFANPPSGQSNTADVTPTVKPTVMHNLKIAIGQMPSDADDGPVSDPKANPVSHANTVMLQLRNDSSAEAPIAPTGAAAARPATPSAPTTQPAVAKRPTAKPSETRPSESGPSETKPALSFSVIAVLLCAAGIGLTFDKNTLDQLRGEAGATIASWLNWGNTPDATTVAKPEAEQLTNIPAQPAAQPGTEYAIAMTQAPYLATSQAGTAIPQDTQIAQVWSTPIERGMVQMPPLTGRVDLAPAATVETASILGTEKLTSVQQAIGTLNASAASGSAPTALPVLESAPQAGRASLAPADPVLQLTALDTELAPSQPIDVSAAIAAILKPSDIRRPLERPVLLAEGQSGFDAERPLFVHIPGREEAALFDDFLATVRSTITPHIETRPVPFKVSRSQVRFYHEQDRANAQAVADAMGVWLHDLTNFRPAPKRGLIELWVQGTNVSPVTPVAARQPRQTRPARPAPQLNRQAAAPQQQGVTIRRVPVAPEARLSPMRRFLNTLRTQGAQGATSIDAFIRDNVELPQ